MDLGAAIECNNCAAQAMWPNMKTKPLPEGWVSLKNTTSGTVHFHDADCRDVWTSTREWRVPDMAYGL